MVLRVRGIKQCIQMKSKDLITLYYAHSLNKHQSIPEKKYPWGTWVFSNFLSFSPWWLLHSWRRTTLFYLPLYVLLHVESRQFVSYLQHIVPRDVTQVPGSDLRAHVPAVERRGCEL